MKQQKSFTMIPFNQPHLTGKEQDYITQALELGKFSGNGFFTKKCHSLLKEDYGFEHVLLTNSATSALEIISILLDLGPEDEIILPSYTFVGTATPFALRGSKLIFCDSTKHHPNIDLNALRSLISSKTKAIVVVHYGGFACELEELQILANEHGIVLIEDAAHSIGASYRGKSLGTFGDLSVFSFHETKNISCGQGGALIINNKKFLERADKIWNKGTNKSDLDAGIRADYQWVDFGSNYYPSEITAAFLLAQLEDASVIQHKRNNLWKLYHEKLNNLCEKGIVIPKPVNYQDHNSHIFFLICNSKKEKDDLIKHLLNQKIMAVFHYLPLEASPFMIQQGNKSHCQNSHHLSDCLVRLPLFNNLKEAEVDFICHSIKDFYSTL